MTPRKIPCTPSLELSLSCIVKKLIINRIIKKEENNMDHEELGGIREIVEESQLVWPSKEHQEQTAMGSQKAFLTLLKASQNDSVNFWNAVAIELHWFYSCDDTMIGS